MLSSSRKESIAAPPSRPPASKPPAAEPRAEAGALWSSLALTRSKAPDLGPGAPLEWSLRQPMEARFGRDFSAVRIHSDSRADAAARGLGAVAYTTGNDVVLPATTGGLETGEGQRRLAHELAHVVQQSGRTVDRTRLEPLDSPAEHEAHDAAGRVLGGNAVPALRHCPAGIARDVGWARRGPIPDAYGMGYNTILTAAGASAEPAVRDLASCEGAGMTLDRSRFEALPDARRRAVIALQPHAAGTACEPWFHALRASQLALTAEGLQGNLYWAGNSGPDVADQYRIRTQATRRTDVNYQTGRETNINEFALWMRGGAVPSSTAKMNCWEAIMFGGFRAGLLTEARLRQLHADAAAAGVTAAASGGSGSGNAAYMATIGAFLGLPGSRALTTSAEPSRGDLVFFGGLDHVALSIGNETVGGVRKHNVMSLWHLPGSGTRLVSVYQRTSVEDIVSAAQSYLGMTIGAITFGPAPWA